MASVPLDQSFNAKWIKFHCQHCLLAENSNAEILITSELYLAGLSRYYHVWKKYFTPFDERIKNLLWGSNAFLPLSSVKHVIILCGNSNLHIDSPYEIIDGIIAPASVLEKTCNNHKIIVCG